MKHNRRKHQAHFAGRPVAQIGNVLVEQVGNDRKLLVLLRQQEPPVDFENRGGDRARSLLQGIRAAAMDELDVAVPRHLQHSRRGVLCGRRRAIVAKPQSSVVCRRQLPAEPVLEQAIPSRRIALL